MFDLRSVINFYRSLFRPACCARQVTDFTALGLGPIAPPECGGAQTLDKLAMACLIACRTGTKATRAVARSNPP